MFILVNPCPEKDSEKADAGIALLLPEGRRQQHNNSEDLKPSYPHIRGQDQLAQARDGIKTFHRAHKAELVKNIMIYITIKDTMECMISSGTILSFKRIGVTALG